MTGVPARLTGRPEREQAAHPAQQPLDVTPETVCVADELRFTREHEEAELITRMVPLDEAVAMALRGEITNAAALELRPQRIQVALLIVDAGIQPLDGSTRPGASPEALADPHRIADAVLYLANQDARSATHELQLTPLAENWTP